MWWAQGRHRSSRPCAQLADGLKLEERLALQGLLGVRNQDVAVGRKALARTAVPAGAKVQGSVTLAIPPLPEPYPPTRCLSPSSFGTPPFCPS